MTGKQLVQGCYAVACVGVELKTFELQGRTLSTEPRRPNQVTITLTTKYCWYNTDGINNVRIKELY